MYNHLLQLLFYNKKPTKILSLKFTNGQQCAWFPRTGYRYLVNKCDKITVFLWETNKRNILLGWNQALYVRLCNRHTSPTVLLTMSTQHRNASGLVYSELKECAQWCKIGWKSFQFIIEFSSFATFVCVCVCLWGEVGGGGYPGLPPKSLTLSSPKRVYTSS